MLTTCLAFFALSSSAIKTDPLLSTFKNPPMSARPWVYWYFMDGNLTREGMLADLQAMKKAGIGGALYLEVGIGIPKGPVEFMSKKWRELVGAAIKESERLGMEMGIGSGPGWCGTGGPWVKPEESMQHLVSSETTIDGPIHFNQKLAQPMPRTPFFGEGTLTPDLKKQWQDFYRDEAVLAFPSLDRPMKIKDADEYALYHRAPYSSSPGVKPFLGRVNLEQTIGAQPIDMAKAVDITKNLKPDGTLEWDVPAGKWTVMRFGRTITGQTTRPAPDPGLGFESDKFRKEALTDHFDNYLGVLLKEIGEPKGNGKGLTTLHFDSWEMSSQNWTEGFAKEFERRRNYSPLKYLPAMSGYVVDSPEKTERFLWDLRQTAQELVIENHANELNRLAKKHKMKLTIEPYDLNPTTDLELGGAADIPGAEFWSKGYGFNTEFSVFEASSIAHTTGKPVVWAEAFTANPGEDWLQHPASMKEQGDWALCAGINRFAFHRYQAQPTLDEKPGMTMSAYGVHWERTQTWWDMVGAYHQYLSRCQQMLRQGVAVNDILYLVPEGAPNVFVPPADATEGDMPDKREYGFDGVAPSVLMRDAKVVNGQIVLNGACYRVLVLPRFETMTPGLLQKVRDLVSAGASVIGIPPKRSPSLTNYPACDEEVKNLAEELWGTSPVTKRKVGKGWVIWDSVPDEPLSNPLSEAKWINYPEGVPLDQSPVGRRYYMRSYDGPIGPALMNLTADNSFTLFVNGQEMGSGNNFHKLYSFDISQALRKDGRNEIGVWVANDGPNPNPAGWIGALAVNGKVVLTSDSSWTVTNDVREVQAIELGSATMSPWNLDLQHTQDVYAPYSLTARVLKDMNVKPDFYSLGSARYIHRRAGNTDIYFIANRSKSSRCVFAEFRVAGKQPEWWDPITGKTKVMTSFMKNDGITKMGIQLDPLQSGFVVFRSPARFSNKAANLPWFKPTQEVVGPWEVAFDSKWGAPTSIDMPKLADWSQSDDPGVRFYSGTAMYKTTFDAIDIKATHLSLGQVKNMAQVKLNGHDLGVAWCDPWRLPIPPNILRKKGNILEVTVANLWINRLIGDSGLPEKKRLTKTTYNPFGPDSPLQPSGLIGPVQLMRAK